MFAFTDICVYGNTQKYATFRKSGIDKQTYILFNIVGGVIWILLKKLRL